MPKYSKEFKEETAKRIVNGEPAAKVARDLGVNVNSIYTWKTRYLEHPEDAFVGSGNLHQEDDEVRKLRKQLRDLQEENDILKKAAAYFAKNQR